MQEGPKKKLQSNISHKFKQKTFHKILANEIQQCLKRTVYYSQVGFLSGVQDWFSIWKVINVIQHINKSKKKNHMIISTDTRRTFEKIQHPVMIFKNLNKLEIELSQSDKGYLLKNLQLSSWWKTEYFSLRSDTRQGFLNSYF